MTGRRKPAFGGLIFASIAVSLAGYFTFAAVQGDYGVFRRAEIEVEGDRLTAELDRLNTEVAHMENLTRRLSDDFLDLDLLDQQARDVLGLVRSDEIVVN